MKILYLHQYFATPESNGGTRSYEMAKRLVKNGHQVTFVTTSAFLPDSYNLVRGWNKLYIEGMEINALHLPYSNTDNFGLRIWKFIQFAFLSTVKALKTPCDVVFATSTPLTIGIPALVYKKMKRKPLVFEVRDLWPELPVAIGAIKNKLLIKILKWFERTIYKNSAQVIALSPGMKDGVINAGYSELTTHVIPNSCDVSMFDIPPQVGEQYKQTNLPFVKKRKLIIYAGTFGLINRVDYLVYLAKAAKELDKNLCFVAIGSGMCKEEVVSLAEKEGVVNDNLYILEPIPKSEITALYSAADLSLSLFGPIEEMWHNSANKLFDSLASQTPIAINYGGWQKEFILETECGILLSENYTSSIVEIDRLLSDSVAYRNAKEACKGLSYDRFSRDRLAIEFEDIIKRAL